MAVQGMSRMLPKSVTSAAMDGDGLYTPPPQGGATGRLTPAFTEGVKLTPSPLPLLLQLMKVVRLAWRIK